MPEVKNFLPEQYARTGVLEINHNYLGEQFSDVDEILKKIRALVLRGEFTLGEEVDRFEEEFAAFTGASFAIGVGSGTDALFLSLKALGIGPGDEVITTPFTFYATIGAVVTAGAKPVFVDVGPDYNIDPAFIEKKITPRTRAILPVHWSGNPCDMDAIDAIAARHGLSVVCDACHSIGAVYKGKKSGSLGKLSCFSFHPLKNLNVWGDGGIIATNDPALSDRLRLLRNHGLAGRDECRVFAYNSRLDSLQAVVARHLLKNKIAHITESRIRNAAYFDEHLANIRGVVLPKRNPEIKQVFHLYQFLCERRDELQRFLISKNVDAKIHYPVPMHLQPAARDWGHTKGDFPVAEMTSEKILSLPVHEFITREQQEVVVKWIREFYG